MPLLARLVIGIFFVYTGLNQLQDLNHSKDVLNFFWISVPAGHRWDPFFPSIELLCGVFALLGLLTRATVSTLLGLTIAAFLNPKLKELTGLNFALPEFVMIALLAGLYIADAGSVSLDRFIFKRKLI
jgi:uncharacterized membrane protein YphA (DoxX/SURF4 family)